jgi:hypothetical protein
MGSEVGQQVGNQSDTIACSFLLSMRATECFFPSDNSRPSPLATPVTASAPAPAPAPTPVAAVEAAPSASQPLITQKRNRREFAHVLGIWLVGVLIYSCQQKLLNNVAGTGTGSSSKDAAKSSSEKPQAASGSSAGSAAPVAPAAASATSAAPVAPAAQAAAPEKKSTGSWADRTAVQVIVVSPMCDEPRSTLSDAIFVRVCGTSKASCNLPRPRRRRPLPLPASLVPLLS